MVQTKKGQSIKAVIENIKAAWLAGYFIFIW